MSLFAHRFLSASGPKAEPPGAYDERRSLRVDATGRAVVETADRGLGTKGEPDPDGQNDVLAQLGTRGALDPPAETRQAELQRAGVEA
ncbi:MAG: hypothetical protein AVDCRST_MAG85-2135 [uncultured Solirubrobacteraceae bacterium]|uniref:Uncharacterized protein n=1 Tax=uncultured Solirubrobacteraceae bacterium TaxID=1162706 RepID=A0A6J4SX85_9ACTN|nr:MAG: hypothetical protein AVDCRST_MAG85-2135 [uncultured Solirubrobacteraceae bacterium]